MKFKLPFLEIESEEIEKIWNSDLGLLVVSVFLFLLSFFISGIIIEGSIISESSHWLIKMAFGVFSLVVVYSLWLYSRKYPKTNKGKIGIVIAIRDNTPEAKKIKNDVIDKFCSITENLPVGNNIQIIPVKDFIAEKAKNKILAKAILDKCRGAFIVYGNALNYKNEKSNQYEFDLSFTVKHRPLNINEQSLLQIHFNESVMDKQWQFLEENPFTIIKVTASNIREIALYIIGSAAFFSFDFQTSLNFHSAVYNLLKEDNEKRTKLCVIYNRLLNYISDSKMILGLQASLSNPEDNELIEKAMKLNEDALIINPNHYPALVNKAKYLFQLGNIEGAKEAIKKIRKINNKNPQLIKDSSWRYSDAFLHFFNEDFEIGRKAYKKAFDGFATEFTLKNVATFLESYVDKNPDKIQFYFVLGIFYYFKMVKITLALDNFEKFREKADNQEKYKLLIEETKNHLNCIKKEIGY